MHRALRPEIIKIFLDLNTSFFLYSLDTKKKCKRQMTNQKEAMHMIENGLISITYKELKISKKKNEQGNRK